MRVLFAVEEQKGKLIKYDIFEKRERRRTRIRFRRR
ncbi:hypothetical protein RCO48_40130 [Peribacillus frigoritolerans]|nr:hypothetical protein [Peribacillus frigoritolerans]